MAISQPRQGSFFRNSVLHIEPSPKWVRCFKAGVAIADSKRALLLRSEGSRRGTPVYYFPEEDVRLDLLTANGRMRTDADIGQAAYYDLAVNGQVTEDAAWRFGEQASAAKGETDEVPDLRGYVAFVWSKLDTWFEEDEEVYQHPRDPYKRIDCLPSSRRVKVVIGGETVAETTKPVLLFETGLVTRYYLPKIDVRMQLLQPSATITRCPYKGLAHYYSVKAGGQVYEDVAWFYPHATPEASKIAGGYIAFYNERVDFIEVDGERMPRPESAFR